MEAGVPARVQCTNPHLYHSERYPARHAGGAGPPAATYTRIVA